MHMREFGKKIILLSYRNREPLHSLAKMVYQRRLQGRQTLAIVR